MGRVHGIPRIKQAFYELDEDGSGSLSLEEILEAPEDTQDLMKEVVDINNLQDLFEFLDEDGSGEVGVDEFADGMMKVAVQDAPIELVQVQSELKRAKFKQDRAEGKLDSMMEMLRTLTENVATLTESIARIEAREAQ